MTTQILVVDDEPDLESLIRQKFRKQIRDGEFEFHFAANGAEALERLAEMGQIEVLLTDLNMPVMDGLTLLAQLPERENPLKSVVISAYGDMENIRTAMNRGAFDFLTKPIDFNDLELTIRKTINEVQDIRAGQQARKNLIAMQQEMELAARIQQSILPKVFPSFPGRKELDLHAEMVPALRVGGDFYDFYLLDDHRLAFMAGDVSGKGMPAALFMAMSRSLLKATALTGVAPEQCLRHVNNLLCADSASGMFVTLFYAVLDTRTGALIYANAGHNPPRLVRRDGTSSALENLGGLVLGVQPDHPYTAGAARLKPGESVFVFTDGVTEAMAPDGSFYTETRLVKRLEQVGGVAAAQVTRAVLDDIHAFAQEQPQHDDITMLMVRYAGGDA